LSGTTDPASQKPHDHAFKPKHRFLLVPNHVLPAAAHLALEKAFSMAISSTSKASTKPTAAKGSRAITLKHLAATLAAEYQLTKRGGEAVLDDLVGLITKHLKKGERVRIAGLGILQVRKRAARMGRNPATGEAIKIKASKKVAFRAAKVLKLAVA
jgi:DNA-binding protein HU-beta